MDVLTYVLAADGTRLAVFMIGWVAGIVSWSLLAMVMTR